MRYEIQSCEVGYEVVRCSTKETLAIFPTLKNEGWAQTERRAELYLASVLQRGQE